MPKAVNLVLLAAGFATLVVALAQAWRFAPRLVAVGQERRFRWLVGLIAFFVVGYAAVLGLAWEGRWALLADLVSAIFLAGAIYVLITLRLVRSTTLALVKAKESLEREVEARTHELADSHRRLEEAKDEAERTNRAKSQFLANMSHEIRTPLTAILGYADLLLRADSDEAQRLKQLEIIRRNGQHLLELIGDVLDLSKIEAGEMTVEHLDCSPWQLAREVRSLLRPQARSRGLAFELEARGPIPELVSSDPVRLRQILLNLVSNAIKFTDRGEVRIVVRWAAADEEASEAVAFDVVDTGIGMTAEQLENVFRPFRQASFSTLRHFGGTGLGLAISRHLARLLGGDITASSVPGEGSTFTLTVDAGLASEDVALMEEPLTTGTLESVVVPAGKVWTTRLGSRILLAEDGVDNRRFIAAVLQQVGAEVTLVEDGEEAVSRALGASEEGEPYDAILMDMRMPVMDGFAAARRLREAGYRGTIVALTAYAMAGDREKCLAAGCDDFMTKPIDIDRFLEALARHVGGQAGRGEPVRSAGAVPGAAAPGGGAPSRPGHGGAAIVSTLADHPKLGVLVEGFVERLPQRIAELEAAFLGADFETLRTLAHSLRGAGGTYGFAPLTEAARDLETRVAAGATRDQVGAAVAELLARCRRARAGGPA